MDKTYIGLHVSPISIPIPHPFVDSLVHLSYSIVDPFPQHYVVFMVQAEDAAIFPPIFWYYVQSMSHFLEVFFMALHKLLNKFFLRLQNQPLKSFFLRFCGS